jgi:hypothetical protein
MIRFEYIYYVAYLFQGGYGSQTISSKRKISACEHVDEIKTLIEKETNGSKVVLINWKLLSFKIRFKK